MKSLLTLIFLGLVAAACGDKKNCPSTPDCPDCPVTEPCPKCPECPTPDPNTICDPNSICPPQQPCPDCPPCDPNKVCDPNVICPQPPIPPVYEDVTHSESEFEITAVLASKGTLGLYLADPNGRYESAVFAMPQLRQKIDFEEVLSLEDDGTPSTTVDDQNDVVTETTVSFYDIGTTEGKDDPYGLVVSALCEREFSDMCSATVTTNNVSITKLVIHVNSANKDFTWTANK